MSKSVVFSQCGRIACAGQSSPEVILCLDDASLLANNTCERTTIEGVLSNVYKDNNCGVNTAWRYVISYDETLLADPTVALVSTDITGIFCKSCLTTWVSDEIACGGGEFTQEPLLVSDTDSIDLTINPDIPQTLSAEIQISADPDNALTIEDDGLFVASGGGGGTCTTEVTTAELNALVAANDLTIGCNYVITDHSQNRVPAGTRVYVTALTVDQISSSCSVLTSYDTESWRGVYDLSLNDLVQLEDNLGNVCRGLAGSEVAAFDWGNTNVTNCLVDGATWTQDIGSSDTFEFVKVTQDGVLTTTASTLGHSNLTVTNRSTVTIGANISVKDSVFDEESAATIVGTAVRTWRYIESYKSTITINSASDVGITNTKFLESTYTITGTRQVVCDKCRFDRWTTSFSGSINPDGSTLTNVIAINGSFTLLDTCRTIIEDATFDQGTVYITGIANNLIQFFDFQCLNSTVFVDVDFAYNVTLTDVSLIETNVSFSGLEGHVTILNTVVIGVGDNDLSIHLTGAHAVAISNSSIIGGKLGVASGALQMSGCKISKHNAVYQQTNSDQVCVLTDCTIFGVLNLFSLGTTMTRTTIEASGSAYLTGGTVLDTLISMGHLINSGQNLTGVYLQNLAGATATAANVNTAKDYFNNTIV